jgi:hypothetical protein
VSYSAHMWALYDTSLVQFVQITSDGYCGGVETSDKVINFRPPLCAHNLKGLHAGLFYHHPIIWGLFFPEVCVRGLLRNVFFHLTAPRSLYRPCQSPRSIYEMQIPMVKEADTSHQNAKTLVPKRQWTLQDDGECMIRK